MSEELLQSPIEIQSGEQLAVISAQGAWLESWDGPNGPILFPKSTLPAGESQKVRGGSHVCLPNFGPGGETGLPQHGFGRELIWEVARRSEADVSMTLDIQDGTYQGLSAELAYRLETDALSMKLTVRNNADKELVLSPGFHPYFPNQANSVTINDSVYDTDSLNVPNYFLADAVSLQTDSASYELRATNLLNWVAWTDKLGGYVCVEPTQSGSSFANDKAAGQPLHLQPGAMWDCELSINAKDNA